MPAYRADLKNREAAGEGTRLIVGDTPTQVRIFLASLWSISSLTAEETIELMQLGVPVENARAKGDEETQVYSHKVGCPADDKTPIGQGKCRCTQLPLPQMSRGEDRE